MTSESSPEAAAPQSSENVEEKNGPEIDNYSWVAGLGFLTLAVLMSLLPTALGELTQPQRGTFAIIQIISAIGFFASSVDWIRQFTKSDIKTLRRYAEVGAVGVIIQAAAAIATVVQLILH